MVRLLYALILLIGAVGSAPASAQFFLANPDLSGPAMRGDEPDIGYTLPGAIPEELRAGLVWSMRAALNVAALQCQFEPTLMTVQNYNAILTDHKAELAKTLDTLTKYFARTMKSRAAGLAGLDRFGTRVYSGFSTVTAQYVFCITAASIGEQAVFAKRGGLSEIAETRMRELRNSLKPHGEQQFPGRQPLGEIRFPRIDPSCWTKANVWDSRKCGKL